MSKVVEVKKIALLIAVLFLVVGCAPAPKAGEAFTESKFQVGSCWNMENDEPSVEVPCSEDHDVYIFSVQHLPATVDPERTYFELVRDLKTESADKVMGMRASPRLLYLREEVAFIDAQTERICDDTLKNINPNYSPTLRGVENWTFLPPEQEWKSSNWVACGLFRFDFLNYLKQMPDSWIERSSMTIEVLSKNIERYPNAYTWCAMGESFEAVSCLEKHNWETWPVKIDETSGYPSDKYATNQENFDAIQLVADAACSAFAQSRGAIKFEVFPYPSLGEWRAGVSEVSCMLKLS